MLGTTDTILLSKYRYFDEICSLLMIYVQTLHFKQEKNILSIILIYSILKVETISICRHSRHKEIQVYLSPERLT